MTNVGTLLSSHCVGFLLVKVVKCHVTRYTTFMIRSFANKETETLFSTGASRRFSPALVSRALRKLDMLDAATCVDDMRLPPSNRLHLLKGDRKGQYSVSINDQWRICFRFEGSDAFDVEICDYH